MRQFKIWVCFVPMLLLWLFAFPINAILLFIPQHVYKFITRGRSLMDDAEEFSIWVTDF
jgi:hypothetical protein